MTCIVGLVHEGRVFIGGDSAGVSGLDLQARADPKVFRNGAFLIGYTSSFRMGQLLRFKFTPPKRHNDVDLFAYMVTDFADAVRQCLKDGGYAERNNDVESGGTFLVGHAGRLFKVCRDYQVAESLDPFDACGCGESYALGHLWGSEGDHPEARIRGALACAERYSGGVRGPFTVLSTEEKPAPKPAPDDPHFTIQP